MRAILSQPDRAWSQSELGERTGLSPGLVSRLLRHLVNEGLLTRDNRLLQVSRADALLDAWAARDDWGKRTTVRLYSLVESDLETIARRFMKLVPEDEVPEDKQEWTAINAQKCASGELEVISEKLDELPTAAQKKKQLGF